MTSPRSNDVGGWVVPAGLYGVVDPSSGEPLDQVRLLAEEGVGVVQLRCKGWPRERLRALARGCVGLPITVVINDDAVLAAEEGLAVHLGQGDGADPGIPFGRSTHVPEHVASAGGASYLGFGPVFGTASKETPYAPRGLGALAAAVALAGVPVVAIGGVGPENLDAVRATGVRGWAVIGAIWRSRDPRAAIRRMRR